MGNDSERISVVIPTKDRVAELKRCIISISQQTRNPFELVIIDAGEIPNPEDFFETFRKTLDIHHIPALVGLTAARNVGILESKGEIILFLDDDTELEPDYLEKLMDVFSSEYHHRIGGVSGKIIDPYNVPNRSLISQIRRAGRKILGRLFLLPVEKDGFFQPAGFPTSPPVNTRHIIPVQCLFGANMAFRREVLTKYKFDEALEGYCFMEDDDIAYRISCEYINIYTPHARLRHFESPVSRDSDFSRKNMLVKNYHYLFRKNFPYSLYRVLAFWWSILGLIIIDIIIINPEGIKGLLAGIHEIRRAPFKNGRCE